MENKKVGIIGVGNVGSTLAYSLASKGICSSIVLKDIRENIKSYDSISKAKEIEFHKELKKHQERTYQEVLKGY